MSVIRPCYWQFMTLQECIMNSFLLFSSGQIYYFIYAVCHLIDNCIVSFFFSRILSPRPAIKHPFLWSLPFTLIPLVYKIATGELHSATHNLFFFASVLLPCLILYRDSLFYRLGSFLFVFVFLLMCENILGIFYYLGIYDFHFTSELKPFYPAPDNDYVGLALVIVPIIIFQAILIPLAIFLWKRYVQYINLKLLIQIGLFHVLSFSGFLFLFPENLGKPGWIFVFLALLFSCLLSFHGLRQIQSLFQTIHFHRKEQELLEQNLSEFKTFQEKSLYLRRQNHDIAGHLQAISYLVEQNQLDKAHQYIQELEENAHGNQD